MSARCWTTCGALLLGGMLLAGCAPSGADDAIVRLSGYPRFEPTVVTVPVGGSVTWHSAGRRVHTVTAVDEDREPTGPFDSGDLVGTGSFRHTFEEAGAYPYVCRYHGDREMIGLVVVGS
jgi:plastocyanin